MAIAVATAPCGPLAGLQAQGAHRTFVCYRAATPPTIDGRLDDATWTAAPRSAPFVDILGEAAPTPSLETRVSMLWDDDYLYVGAMLEEPHLWATLTERDARIFDDDDFEIFLDPDGDTHHYYEIEINALGTVWDLFLVKPYRDGGPAISAWDIRGLHSAVAADGTVNDPSDTDRGWTVELAIPWQAITETAPGHRRPQPGDQWRVNFSRVDWQVRVVDGGYQKAVDPASRRPLAERNWVWSPQSAVNMHMPERWGFVQFSDLPAGHGTESFVDDVDEPVRRMLRAVYHAQRAYRSETGAYARSLQELELPGFEPSVSGTIEVEATARQYTASLPSRHGIGWWHIRDDGRVWRTP